MWKNLVQDSSLSVIVAIDSAETWFNADTTRMSNPSNQYKNFKRFQRGMMNRLDSGGFWLPSNDKYLMALENIYNASPLPAKPASSSNLLAFMNPVWKGLGPFEPPKVHLSNSYASSTGIGRITCVRFHPTDPDQIFIGTQCGLYKTENGGLDWQIWHTDEYLYGAGVSCILIDPTNPDNMIIGTGNITETSFWSYSVGIFSSSDGGYTWNHFGGIFPGNFGTTHVNRELIMDLAIHPDSSSIVFGLGNEGSLFKTTNFGQSWTLFHNLNSYAPHHGCMSGNTVKGNGYRYISFVKDTNNATIMFLTGNWIMRSDHFGQSFTNLTNNLIPYSSDGNGICNLLRNSQIAQFSGDTIKVAYNEVISSNATTMRIKYSTDYGNSWFNLIGNINADFNYLLGNQMESLDYEMGFTISPHNSDRCYILGRNIQPVSRSLNRGGLFFPSATQDYDPGISTKMHADGRGLDIFSSSYGGEDMIVVANDGGVSLSTNSGATWKNITGYGINATQFYSISISENGEDVAGGTLDNSSFLYSGGLWRHIGSSDGGTTLFSKSSLSSPEKLFYSIGLGAMTTDKNADYKNSNSVIPINNLPSKMFDFPFEKIPHSQDTYIMARGDGFYYSNTNPDLTSWHLLHPGIFDSSYFYYPRHIGLSPADTTIIYLTWFTDDIWDTSRIAKNRVLVTNNGLNSDTTDFVDITNGDLKDALKHYNIAALEVDPTNADRVWVAITGYSDKRLFKTEDRGITWKDITGDLTSNSLFSNFPIHDLESDYDLNEGLFVATDIGVFYNNKNLYSIVGPDTIRNWHNINAWHTSDNLPASRCHRIKISRDGQYLYAGTFGRGVWKCDLNPVCALNSTPIVISGNIIWNTSRKLQHNLIIDSTASLTIHNSRVNFPRDASITIKRGGKLILDNALLTSCNNDEMWGGIQVWGDSAKPQTDLTAHGKLEIKNGSIIENAHNAVIMARVDNQSGAGNIHWDYTGGIIEAENSVFRNIGRAVAFLSYHNKHIPSGYEMKNASKIEYCQFINNRRLNISSKRLFAFITMFDVLNVAVRGNTFTNEAPRSADVTGNMGIYLEHAHLNLNANIPAFQNTFQGLRHGIYVRNFNQAYRLQVKNNKFIDNYRGIRIENSVQPKIIGNEFKIKGWDEEINIYGCYVNPFYQSYDSTYASYGLMLDKSSGYTVEGNDFSSYNGVSVSSNNIGFDRQTGIVVSESGPAANELYGNRFHDLLVGIRAQGVNGQYGPILSFGLDYKCNEFEDEIFTACIGSAKGAIIDIVQGKMQYQPFSDFDPAGNLLKSNSTFPNPIPDQFWIDSDYSTSFFQYVHHNISDYSPQSGRYVTSKVIPVNSGKTLIDFPCENDSTPYVSPGSGSAAFSRIGIINYLVDSISQILVAGNHDSLFVLADSDSLPLVSSTLSTFSPYLSHRVLKKLIAKAKVNPAQEYFDLLVENSPLPVDLYEHCEEIDFDSIQLLELDSLQEGYSPLIILQNEGSNYATERDRILYKQIELWLEAEDDTIRYEKVINLLNVTPTLQAKFQQVDYLILLRAYSEASSLLDSIGLAESEWTPYTDIYKDLLPILNMPGSWYNLPSDSASISRMLTHVRDALPGSANLVPLLDFCLERFSCEDIQALNLPEAESERRGEDNSDSNNENITLESFNVYPNPNSGLVNILFKSNSKQKGIFNLMGITGTNIITGIELKANEEIQINLENQPIGIYFLRLEIDGQIFTQKFIKQ